MEKISALIEKTLKTKPVVYVTRDIERALGLNPLGGYFAISRVSGYGKEIKSKFPENTLLVNAEQENGASSSALLCSESTKKFIKEKNAAVLVFQNSSKIESCSAENGFELLNNSSAVSKKIEEKASQYEWLGDLRGLLPKTDIMALKSAKFAGKPFILQYNHAHTGEGTMLIKTALALTELSEKFPERLVRISDFVSGPVFTVNAVVSGNEVLCGNVSYQITGIAGFTDNEFSTIGNDWSLPLKILSAEEIKNIKDIAIRVGQKMMRENWRGLFGIDAVMDGQTRKIYLLEINARQPASTTFESILQKQSGEGASVFESHIAALLKLPAEKYPIQGIPGGAQIVFRKQHRHDTQKPDLEKMKNDLESRGFAVIAYETDGYNKELLRIQSKSAIMDSHNQLGDAGKIISECLKS